MKHNKKEEKPSKPSSSPANRKQDDPQIKNNPRQEDRSSIDKEIDKRTAENRTPKGENL
jgi:hypothetical protein